MLSVEIPLRLGPGPNGREHWRRRAARTRRERDVVSTVLLARVDRRALSARRSLLVTLTRTAPRQLDDDNLRGAFKAVRDGIAHHLGLDDADPRLTWRYAQERAPRPRTYAIRIELAEYVEVP